MLSSVGPDEHPAAASDSKAARSDLPRTTFDLARDFAVIPAVPCAPNHPITYGPIVANLRPEAVAQLRLVVKDALPLKALDNSVGGNLTNPSAAAIRPKLILETVPAWPRFHDATPVDHVVVTAARVGRRRLFGGCNR